MSSVGGAMKFLEARKNSIAQSSRNSEKLVRIASNSRKLNEFLGSGGKTLSSDSAKEESPGKNHWV